jgi:prophage regulatory protein
MQTVKILPTTETLAKVGVKSRNTVHDWVKSQDFPKPVQLGGNRIGWIESEVDAWLAKRPRGFLAPVGIHRPEAA